MITIVNGYLCYCSCDAAKAMQGENPRTAPGSLPSISHEGSKTSGLVDHPATILNGALKNLSTSSAIKVAASALGSTSLLPQSVNLLV
jgi:hypothetical protein